MFLYRWYRRPAYGVRADALILTFRVQRTVGGGRYEEAEGPGGLGVGAPGRSNSVGPGAKKAENAPGRHFFVGPGALLKCPLISQSFGMVIGDS